MHNKTIDSRPFSGPLLMRPCYLWLFVCINISKAKAQTNFDPHKINARIDFDPGWEFVRGDTSLSGPISWQAVSLPHTPHIEPVVKTVEQWQGTCYYRKPFTLPPSATGKHIAIQFDAAMNEAEVYLNGKHIFTHRGGFLPFYIDITEDVKWGEPNILLVKLNNRDNPVIPPGKPIKDLDFNFYGGLYRHAWLIIKDKLYITDAIQAGHEAGGGILIHDSAVSAERAVVVVKTELKNDYDRQGTAFVKVGLTDNKGRVVGASQSRAVVIGAHDSHHLEQTLTIIKPALWSPIHPYLYRLHISVIQNGKVVDEQWLKTGIRTFAFRPGGFFLNGQKLNIVGTNRHQEYPYIGYALSDNAQYRDAYKIKSAGLNFVRCSHYPPSPAFLDACDELGIMVMDAIPGWQFFGDSAFRENSYQNIRDMIRRDRNHASIVLWEAALNESGMSKGYMDTANRIVHRELPFTDVFSSGWLDYAYDVSNPARQHAKAPDYWSKYSKPKPLLLAEYGDWEYYALNAGFNQKQYADLKADQRNSRQTRGDGEQRLLQQALNFQEAHNDNLNGPCVGDASWTMFDYKRGYAPDIEASGMMDIFRLPKFTYYFFQSQSGPSPDSPIADSPAADGPVADGPDFAKPMVFIANYWNNPADSTVKIYSNCRQVKLLLNGKSIGIQNPDSDRYSTHLLHPPYTFRVRYAPGTLRAIGYINGREAASDTRKTPGRAYKIVLKADISGKNLAAGCNDAVFVYGYVTDENGTPVPDATDTLHFQVSGSGKIEGLSSPRAEAGIAAVLVEGGDVPGKVLISASAGPLKSGVLSIALKKCTSGPMGQ